MINFSCSPDAPSTGMEELPPLLGKRRSPEPLRGPPALGGLPARSPASSPKPVSNWCSRGRVPAGEGSGGLPSPYHCWLHPAQSGGASVLLQPPRERCVGSQLPSLLWEAPWTSSLPARGAWHPGKSPPEWVQIPSLWVKDGSVAVPGPVVSLVTVPRAILEPLGCCGDRARALTPSPFPAHRRR